MKAARWFRRAAVAAAFACAGCSGLVQPPQRVSQHDAPRQGRVHQLIVTLAGDAQAHWDTMRQGLAADYDMREAGAFPLASIRVQCVVYELSDEPTLEALLERLARDARVESVQRNQAFDAFEAPAPPGRGYRALAYGAAAIRADLAHRSSTGKGVRVAVVDTGVDRRHKGLRGRVAQSANFVEHGEISFDDDRHGTAVAGIIGAHDEQHATVLGIAPEAELIAIKACWHVAAGAKALCSSWTLAKAVDYAIDARAQVLNLSLAGPPDALLARLLTAAHGRGMTIVAATTDSSAGPGFPASLEAVLAVVASDVRDHVSTPAWPARRPLLAAPGVEVVSTVPRDGYELMSGSSFAAAHVSGVAALLLQHAPALGPAGVAQIMSTTARPTTEGAAAGIVDACAALTRLRGAGACN
jgi:subtilisin family serine protease